MQNLIPQWAQTSDQNKYKSNLETQDFKPNNEFLSNNTGSINSNTGKINAIQSSFYNKYF